MILTCSKCKASKHSREFSGWAEDRKLKLDKGCLCDECRGTRPLDYDRRNRFLKVLGFNSYSHYLNSEMWATIRNLILRRDGGKCVVCKAPAVNVHHNSYEMDVLIGKETKQLVSLCRKHHEEAEFDETTKRELPDVRLALASKGLKIHPLIRREIPARVLEDKRDDGPMTKARLARRERQLAAIAKEEAAGRRY